MVDCGGRRNPCYTTLIMSTEPKLFWYQFSLRSLLLLTLFVAVLCSIGVCTHWLISVAIGMIVVIGGFAGPIVAGTRLGFVQGIVYGIQFFLVAGLLCTFLPFPWAPSWRSSVVLALAVLVGGVLGGLSLWPRPKR